MQETPMLHGGALKLKKDISGHNVGIEVVNVRHSNNLRMMNGYDEEGQSGSLVGEEESGKWTSEPMAVLIDRRIFFETLGTTEHVQNETMGSLEVSVQSTLNRQIVLMKKARIIGSIDTFELTCMLWGG